MRVITNKRLLFGDQMDVSGRILGTVPQDAAIDLDDRTAAHLLAKGAARVPPRPAVIYETKIVIPEAPQARPFRDLYTADDCSAEAVATVLAKVLAKPDVQTPEPARRKRGRPRKGSTK